jgi:hypothetical protein
MNLKTGLSESSHMQKLTLQVIPPPHKSRAGGPEGRTLFRFARGGHGRDSTLHVEFCLGWGWEENVLVSHNTVWMNKHHHKGTEVTLLHPLKWLLVIENSTDSKFHLTLSKVKSIHSWSVGCGSVVE